MPKAIFCSAREAALCIADGATVAISGNGAGMIAPETIFAAIEELFRETGHPCGITLVHSLGIGDRGEQGTNRFAHRGLLRRVIAAHFTWSTRIQEMIRREEIEAYCFPGGVLQQLLREIGAGRPGLYTTTGLGTFVDPRFDGGRCNSISRDSLVELHLTAGREYLHYKPFPIDIAIVRGTYADERGNISTEEEAVDLDVHSMALAAHNRGGQVLVQVRELVPAGSRHPRHVRIPGVMVDRVVTAPAQPQFYGLPYDSSISGLERSASLTPTAKIPEKLDRRIIARRAAQEIRPDLSLNFGFGIPGGIFGVIAEKEMRDDVWMSVEQGIHNGTLLDDHLFGAARHADAILSSVDQFDYYSGGGIDIAFLGLGEMDAAGNVNVSHLGGNLIGPGGFMDIAQNAKKVVFCGTFDAQGGRAAWDGARLRIIQPGALQKLVAQVYKITFAAKYSGARGQEVLYITERAVFRLENAGVTLIEIAPGLEVERDLLPHMGFRPKIGNVKEMDPAVFR